MTDNFEINHLEILGEVRKLSTSSDQEALMDVIEYLTHHGPTMPPEVAQSLLAWYELLSNEDPEVSQTAQLAFEEAARNGQFPEELVFPILDGFHYH